MELRKKSNELRKKIFRMIKKAGGGHIGPSFSMVEILTTLYFGGVLKYDPKNPKKQDRDRFVLSKGHASAALYAILSMAGFFEEVILDSFCQSGTSLGGHPNMHEIPGVEASTGALGHGFPFAVGMALAGKLDEKEYRTYVVLGDGECQEGTIWEAAMFAAQQKLGFLTAIVDYNKLQAMDVIETIVGLEPFVDKWKAFGWDVYEVDGHSTDELLEVFTKKANLDSKPRMIIAHTVKGKGVSFMENQPLWHYRLPNEEEMNLAMKELCMTMAEVE